MDFTRLVYETGDRVVTITLNRPAKRNALDDIMVKELSAAVTKAGKEPDVKVLLVKAAGPAFCSGADLEYLRRMADFDLEENRADSFRLANLFRMLYELRKPVVAVVDGPALAGGSGLAAVCDFVIASRENALFGFPEVKIGFIPAIVLVFLVKRVGEGKARELVLRGATFDAAEAQAIGLVSHVVPSAQLDGTARALVDELVHGNSQTSMGLCKEMLTRMHGMNFVDAMDFASNINAAARMTAECKNGMSAFLEKRKITW